MPRGVAIAISITYGLFGLIFLAGCTTTTTTEPIPEPARTAVYATNDSLHKRRVDLALQYSDQSVRLIPPPAPENRITIRPIYSNEPTAEQLYNQRLKAATEKAATNGYDPNQP